jgi:glutathione S-transferase
VYLFVILSWAKRLELDLSRWPSLVSFTERMRQRPAVQEALKAEGLT